MAVIIMPELSATRQNIFTENLKALQDCVRMEEAVKTWGV